MLPSFLTRPVRRLRADGVVEALAVREPALGPPTLLLARSLCRFERFTPPAGLPGRAALAAARLHARTRAPYAAPASALTRGEGAFGLWWWDREAVGAALQAAAVDAPVRLRPEAAAQPAGDGLRILRSGEGFEAQRWTAGFLADSRWRAAPFDAAAWQAFARLAPGEEALANPPAVQVLPLLSRAPYGRRFVRETDVAGLAPAVALLAVTASLACTGFFVGQGVSAARRDAGVRAALAARDAAPTRSRRPELAARAQRLAALAQIVDRPDPVTRLAEAQRILTRFGLHITSFDSRAGELTVSVPASAVAGVDLVVEELEASAAFHDVRPVLDRETRRLTLRMAVRG